MRWNELEGRMLTPFFIGAAACSAPLDPPGHAQDAPVTANAESGQARLRTGVVSSDGDISHGTGRMGINEALTSGRDQLSSPNRQYAFFGSVIGNWLIAKASIDSPRGVEFMTPVIFDARPNSKFQEIANSAAINAFSPIRATLFARLDEDGSLRLYMSTVVQSRNGTSPPAETLLSPPGFTPAAGPGAYLSMQDDGNVVLYTSAGKAVWENGRTL